MELTESLKKIGLSEKEAAVYVALLQIGRASVYSIANKSGLKRPTVYVVLHELIEKGVVERVPRSRKQLYVAKAPDEVFAVAAERLSVAREVLPELRALSKEGSGTKVRTTYYEGLKQVQDAYFDTLRHGGDEFVGWLSNTPFEKKGREFWYQEYQTKRLDTGIEARVIIPNVPWMREYAGDDAKTMKESRIDTDKKYSVDAEVLIYGEDRIVMTSFSEEMGLIIESKKIHDTLRAIFERHWDALASKTV